MKFDELNVIGIYCLEFATNKFYIGASKNVYKRYKQHCYKLKAGSHTAKLQNEYNITKELPTIKILSIMDLKYLDVFEQARINEYRNTHGTAKVLNSAGIGDRGINVLRFIREYS